MANNFAVEPENAVTHAGKLGIAASIRGTTSAVVATIDFNYEVRARGQEIDDGVSERHLTPKPDAELATTNV